jgi:uncharacterized protein (TIGR00369 family)
LPCGDDKKPSDRVRAAPALDSAGGRQASFAVRADGQEGNSVTEIGRAHSGYADLLGYQLTERKVDYAEVTLKVGPQHLNRLSIPHGGVLATLLDSATGFAAAFFEHPDRPRVLVTLSFNILFIGQARLGDTLIARGRRIGGGKSIAYCSGELTTADGRQVARADAVFKFLGKAA